MTDTSNTGAGGEELDLEALDRASGGQAAPQTVIIEDHGHRHHHHHGNAAEILTGIAAVLGAVAGTAAVINSPAQQQQPQPQPDPQQGGGTVQPDNFQGN